MKNTVKVLFTILLVVLLLTTISGNVFAADKTESKSKAETIIDGIDKADNPNSNTITSVGGKIASIITTVGIVVALIVVLIIGIKYMIGSAEEKAEYKKTMIPYLVGAVLLGGGSAIVKAVFSMTEQITG